MLARRLTTIALAAADLARESREFARGSKAARARSRLRISEEEASHTKAEHGSAAHMPDTARVLQSVVRGLGFDEARRCDRSFSFS
jgi:hypothetical protein